MLIATKLTLCLFTVETCVVSMLILCVNAQFNLNAPNRHSSSANSLPLEPLQFNPLESSPPNEPTPETNDAMSASPYSNNHFVQSEPIQVYSNDPKLSGTDSRDGQPAAIVDAGNIDQTSATLNAPTYSPYNRYPQPSSKTYVGAYYPNYYNSMYPSGFGAYPNAYGLGSYNPNPLQPLVGHFYAKFQPVAQFFQKITGKLMAPFASKFMPGYGYGTHLGSPYTNAFDYNSYGKMFPYKSPAALFRNEPRARNLDEPGLYVNGPTYNMQPNTFGSSILNGNPTEIAPRENWAIGAKSVQAEPGRLAKLIQNGGNPAQFSYREQFHSNSVVNGKQTSTSGVISLKSPENGTPTGVVNAVQVNGQSNN